MHLNIRGLRSKMEELQLGLKKRNIYICSLNETFVKPKIKVDIPGYHLLRKDRLYIFSRRKLEGNWKERLYT